MNGQSADRLTSREIKETIEGIVSHRKHVLSFVSRPERYLEIARDRVASLKDSLAKAEKQLAEYESLLQDHTAVVDALDASIAKKNQVLLLVRMKERIQRWHKLMGEKAELEAPVTGDPEAVTEDMIVS